LSTLHALSYFADGDLPKLPASGAKRLADYNDGNEDFAAPHAMNRPINAGR